MTRWRYNDPPLLWLFVAAYFAHVVEELLGGFPAWLGSIFGRPLSMDAFLAINVVGLAVVSFAAWLSTRSEARGWLGIAIATVLFTNGLLHILGSLATASYSPGLITGVVLYLPLGQLALLRAWHQVSPSFFMRGVVCGLVAHGVVTVVARIAIGGGPAAIRSSSNRIPASGAPAGS
jgi:hypothetical protein